MGGLPEIAPAKRIGQQTMYERLAMRRGGLVPEALQLPFAI